MFGLTVQRLGRRVKIELLVPLRASAMTNHCGPTNSISVYTVVAGPAVFDRGGSVAAVIAFLYKIRQLDQQFSTEAALWPL